MYGFYFKISEMREKGNFLPDMEINGGITCLHAGPGNIFKRITKHSRELYRTLTAWEHTVVPVTHIS
jgi:hypothetical protein